MAVLRWTFLLCFLFCLAWTRGSKSFDHGSDIQFIEDPIRRHSFAAPNQVNIGSFNIQVFGQAKMGKFQVVQILRKILVRYDIVLIQEIRDASESAISQLLNEVNQESGNAYEMKISSRLGRSVIKEQYAYFFRKKRVRITAMYEYPDSGGVFERPPFVVKVQAFGTRVNEFGFIGIHVKPARAVQEMNGLVDVYDHMKQQWNTEDFVLGGDFNAGCTYVTASDWPRIELCQQNRFKWLIDNNTRTNLGTIPCPYDRFVIAGSGLRDAYVEGSAAVYKFDEVLSLLPAQARDVSDHYPIEFLVQ